MAEEEGLSYTVRFIPDTTAIDTSIKDISARVAKEINEGIDKGRKGAGVTPAKEAPTVSGGIMDEFRKLKERVTTTLQEIGVLGGRARGLGHPASATVGSVTELTTKKLAAGDPNKLTTDQVLQMLSGMLVTGGRALAAPELMPTLSKEEAIERSIQDQLGSLKGIAEQMFGFKEFKSMKGLSEIIRMSDLYERGMGATGKAMPKAMEHALMESFGHDIMAKVGTAMQETRGAAEWEAKEISFKDLYKAFGYQGDEKAVPGAADKVADLVRVVGGMFEVTEFKTKAEGAGAAKFARDIANMNAFLATLNASKEMRTEFEAKTGVPVPPEGVKATGKLMAGSTQGAVEKTLQESGIGEFVEGLEYEEIGDQVRRTVIKNFMDQLPAFQRELETLLIDLTPSQARTHVESLLENIEPLLDVLRARSLPKFWLDIGVDRWIKQSAVEYVGALKEEITPELYKASKEDLFPDLATPEPTAGTTTRPTSDSELILGKLDTMDAKLDEIKEELPRGTGTPYGSLLGSMKSNSEGE